MFEGNRVPFGNSIFHSLLLKMAHELVDFTIFYPLNMVILQFFNVTRGCPHVPLGIVTVSLNFSGFLWRLGRLIPEKSDARVVYPLVNSG